LPLPPDRPQRILFYLPMVTNWWFVHIVEPLIRRLASVHEVHVLAPVPWRGTGIGPEELARCADLPDISWYIMDGPDHPSTRTLPEDAEGLIGFVRDLAPNYVLCRTADHATVRHFPGIVRLLMEGRFEPFAPPPHWILLADRPHDQGLLPPLAAGERESLRARIAPAWARLHDRLAPRPGERAALFERLRIPADRPVLLLPLECETEDNFFTMHRLAPAPNASWVRAISKRVGDRFTLVVTNHPINDAHVDAAPLLAAIDECDNAVLLPPAIGGLPATLGFARHADGMLLGDSKTFALGAFFRIPMLRHSRFATGDWLQAYGDWDAFLGDVATGAARRPQERDARLWFAHYLLNEAFDPSDRDDDVLARMDRPCDPARWDAALTRLERALPALFAGELQSSG
jgi:hypothetical protein